MSPRKLHALSFFTTMGLLALAAFGKIFPATPRSAEAQGWPSATPTRLLRPATTPTATARPTRTLTQKSGYLAGVIMGAIHKHDEAGRYHLTRPEIFGTRSLDDFLNYIPWRGQGLDVYGGPPAQPTPNVARQK